jgi:hypothetical protein
MSNREKWENRAVCGEQQTVLDILQQVEASASEPSLQVVIRNEILIGNRLQHRVKGTVGSDGHK